MGGRRLGSPVGRRQRVRHPLCRGRRPAGAARAALPADHARVGPARAAGDGQVRDRRGRPLPADPRGRPRRRAPGVGEPRPHEPPRLVQRGRTGLPRRPHGPMDLAGARRPDGGDLRRPGRRLGHLPRAGPLRARRLAARPPAAGSHRRRRHQARPSTAPGGRCRERPPARAYPGVRPSPPRSGSLPSSRSTRRRSAASPPRRPRSWRGHRGASDDDHDLLGVSCAYAVGVAADGSFHPLAP